MSLPDASTPAGWAAAIGAGLTGLVWGARSMYVHWRRGDVQVAGLAAEQTLVQTLHAELLRLTQHNVQLASEVAKLQLHMVELTHQISGLSTENSALTQRVAQLHSEVDHLRALLARAEALTQPQKETPAGMQPGGGFN